MHNKNYFRCRFRCSNPMYLQYVCIICSNTVLFCMVTLSFDNPNLKMERNNIVIQVPSRVSLDHFEKGIKALKPYERGAQFSQSLRVKIISEWHKRSIPNFKVILKTNNSQHHRPVFGSNK